MAGTLACAAFAMVARAQDVPPAVTEALNAADAAVAKIIAVPPSQRTFDNTVGALDDLGTNLDTATSLPIFMQNVAASEKEREDARAAEEVVTAWQIALGKNEELYKVIKAYADTHPQLKGEQKRLLEFTLRDYRRSGMDLSPEDRKKVADIEIELQKLTTDFQKNIYDDESVVFLSEAETKGLPADVKKGLKRGGDFYILTMDGPTFNAAMDYLDNEQARERVWFAYKRRGGQKNVRLLERILKLRNQEATMLGYKTTVDFEIETRMAKNSGTVAKFYSGLQPLVRVKAKADYAQFLAAKKKLMGAKATKLYPWDYSYLKQYLLKTQYAVDSQKVAEYFPVQRVFDGLFQVTSRIYGIQFKDVTANAPKLGLPVWDADVKLWEVSDKKSGELLGHIYTDLFPRPNKYNHAACWGLMPRKVWSDGTVQKPLAALVCNFTKPTADKPSLMTHDEVTTFFHEFGHGLHQLLTETQYGRFSGTAVARDFVEAPSQMFENWVWSPEVLATFAKHYKTNKVLPTATLEAMKNARSLGSGIEAEHQFYYGLVDQAYHTAKGGVIDTTKTGVDMLAKVELYPAPIGTWFQSSFGHLMGYQGAYYGYQWSLVYAQDMFTRFEKHPLDPKVGMEYRKKVLAKGGSEDEMEMLRGFLGRDPNMDAYFRNLGVTKKKK